MLDLHQPHAAGQVITITARLLLVGQACYNRLLNDPVSILRYPRNGHAVGLSHLLCSQPDVADDP